MPKPQQLASAAEIAERYGCSVSTIHRMVLDGRLKPAVKFPGIRGAYMFDLTQIPMRLPSERATKAAS